MADIICTVPGCEAQAVLVLNGSPICRLHCEEFAQHASIVDGSFRDVLTAPPDGPRPIIAGLLPSNVQPKDDPNAPG